MYTPSFSTSTTSTTNYSYYVLLRTDLLVGATTRTLELVLRVLLGGKKFIIYKIFKRCICIVRIKIIILLVRISTSKI